MRTFRVKIDTDIAPTEKTITAVDLPDIIKKHDTYFIKTGQVEYNQIAALNSSYKNFIYHYKQAVIVEI